MKRLRFGAFEADLDSGELWADGALVPLQDLPFRLLAALLERPGELVTRAELTTRLWGTDTFVDATAGLNTAVAKLRDALADQSEQPRFIETVPKRGYRFVGQIETHAVETGESSSSNVVSAFRRTALVAVSIVAVVLVAIVVVIAATAAYKLRAGPPQTRVAVILFDNETDQPEFGRLAQGLTDATVFALTANPRLAVIGNAAILRTPRPFRDMVAVRDALHADFIIIGQVQIVDGSVLIRTHLIRAKDQAHVWVDVTQMGSQGEAVLQSAVSEKVRAAMNRSR
jgi:DNA-binding winged helix-turn-helix (wHTH) protein